jgi:hypothetical protein
MSRFFHDAVRSFTSFFGFIFDLPVDGLRFLCVTVRSRSTLGAEVLFLRKQLAFYEERETQPRRLNNSARVSLVIWSQLFDWRSCSSPKLHPHEKSCGSPAWAVIQKYVTKKLPTCHC